MGTYLLELVIFFLPCFIYFPSFSFLFFVGKMNWIIQSPILVGSTSHLHMLNYQRLVHLRVSQVEDAAESILVQLNRSNKFLAPLPGIGNIVWFYLPFLLYFIFFLNCTISCFKVNDVNGQVVFVVQQKRTIAQQARELGLSPGLHNTKKKKKNFEAWN